MISALLLPLMLTGAPASPAAASQDDPPIRLWINNDRRFLPGDRAKVEVRTEDDGYLLVFHVDPEGRLRVLFPLDPDKDNFVRGGKKYEVKGRGGREAFDVDATGRGAIYGAVSRDPFRLDGFVLGDHWDYRALAPTRLREDPEPELNELVHRMAQGSYDYDLMTYDVISRSAYASSYAPAYRSYGYDDPWCYSFSCGRPYYGSPFGVSVGLFYGRPYRRYYYDPYYYAYDPIHNPFFYDPYYYAPTYYPRYVYPHRYYGYHDRYYYDRGGYDRAYTPYRFRGSDRYRDRRQDLRSVNTVYLPPVSRVRQPVTTNPVRRVIEHPASELPSNVAPRRTVSNERRSEPIVGRRASQPEVSRPTVSRDDRRSTTPRETTPVRTEAEPRQAQPREQPRAERTRAEPRQVDRPAPEARPQRREADRGSSAAPQNRGSGRVQSSGSGGGSRPAPASRPSNPGGRRR